MSSDNLHMQLNHTRQQIMADTEALDEDSNAVQAHYKKGSGESIPTHMFPIIHMGSQQVCYHTCGNAFPNALFCNEPAVHCCCHLYI